MLRILSALLLCSFISCGQTNKKQSENDQKGTVSDWKTLEEGNYSIQYPADWELNQKGELGTTFFIFSPAESDQDQFRENVNLLIQDLTGYNMDLDKFTELSEGQVKTMITNSKQIESKRIKNESGEHHYLHYTGDQGVFHLQYEQYYWVKDKKAYILSFASEQKKYDDYKKTGESILNSFTLKK